MLRKGFESMSVNVTEIFGSNVFSTAVMRERLPKGRLLWCRYGLCLF